MADNVVLNPGVGGDIVATDDVGGVNFQRIKLDVGGDGVSSPVVGSLPVSPVSAALTEYTQAGVIAINTVLVTLDCLNWRSASIQCTSMGTTGVVTPEWSNNGTTWVAATIFTAAGASATTFNAAGLWVLPVFARYLRLRLSTATTAGTTTLSIHQFDTPAQEWLAIQPVVHNGALAGGNSRIGNVGSAGIWYDDSSTVLAANATFTGSSRDLTVTATATTFANAATYAKEVRVSAESDQSGTLWVEFSRDNTNWRRTKSVATAAVTGGGQFAEIVFRPSWRYMRVGFTNGATLQTRFTIGSILIAI